MPDLTRPPSLQTFLGAGGDITTIPGWECLAEAVVLCTANEATRHRFAQTCRRYAETWLAGDTTWLDERLAAADIAGWFAWFAGRSDSPPNQQEHPHPEPPTQDVVTRFLWEAECLEDPELAARLEAALPEDCRARLRNDLEVFELEASVYGSGVDPPVEWPRDDG